MRTELYLQLLKSNLPSQRIRAAQWAASSPVESRYRNLLVEAAQSEGVPRIRQLLELAVRRIDEAATSKQREQVPGTQSPADEILRNISKAIQHETESAIGRLRFAASREVPEFELSETNAAIQALRRRVDGLASLAEAHRIAEKEFVSLSSTLNASISPEHPAELFIKELDTGGTDEIFTDAGLLSLILTNAIDNAVDASMELPIEHPRILISANVTDARFWITIRNGFAGQSFDLRSIGASGRTTKMGHRGMGTKIVQLACERLGYEFELTASGAVATFVLRGSSHGR